MFKDGVYIIDVDGIGFIFEFQVIFLVKLFVLYNKDNL